MAGDDTVTVTVKSDHPDSQAWDLESWLQGDAALRRYVSRPRPPAVKDTLGGADTVVLVTLASTAVTKAFRDLLLEWIRQQRTDLSVEVRRGTSDVKLTASVPHAEIPSTLENLNKLLMGPCSPDGGDGTGEDASPRG